jgi:hypothetical protein
MKDAYPIPSLHPFRQFLQAGKVDPQNITFYSSLQGLPFCTMATRREDPL